MRPLYFQTTWADDELEFQLEKTDAYPDPVYALTIEAASAEAALAFRVPSYVDSMEIQVNGRPAAADASGGCLTLQRSWQPGDRVTIRQVLATRIVTPEGRRLRLEEVGQDPLQGYLFHGPYLLAVDGVLEPEFVSEPSWDNIILTPAQPSRPERDRLAGRALPEAYFQFAYQHGGYFELQPVVLRPLSELAYGDRANAIVAFTFKAAR